MTKKEFKQRQESEMKYLKNKMAVHNITLKQAINKYAGTFNKLWSAFYMCKPKYYKKIIREI